VRVLVTGGSGFLGRQIVAALRAQGAEVCAPARQEADLLSDAGRRVAVGAARAELLVHAAWITRPGAYWHSTGNVDWVTASIDLARRFAAAGGRRIVFAGTCAEYDWSCPGGAPWPESRPCRPHTPYGAAKLLAWTALCRLGIPAANARLFWPVGPHEHPDRLLPSLVRAALTGHPVATGPAALTRDLIDVRDAAEAVARVALGTVRGVVNIGSGRAVRLGDLAAAVGGAARLGVGARSLPPGEPLCLLPDISRLRRATGFTPRIPLHQTIADAFTHWQAQGRAA
jgi:nucleoside-diphosphate-sugar epimerase